MKAITQLLVFALLLCLSDARISLAQSAALSGTVLADSSERPLVNAEVRLPKLDRSVRSDSAGNFRFNGLRPGVHQIVVRLVGYEPITTTLRIDEGKTLESEFLLKPVTAKLAAVEVREKSSIYAMRLNEFESNRKSRPGRFLTAEVFEEASGRSLGDVIISKIAGARLMPCPPGKPCPSSDVIATTRGNGFRPGPCPMQVVLNGLVVSQSGSLSDIITDQVIGLEFYSMSTTPMQWSGTGSQCGTVVIYTK